MSIFLCFANKDLSFLAFFGYSKKSRFPFGQRTQRGRCASIRLSIHLSVRAYIRPSHPGLSLARQGLSEAQGGPNQALGGPSQALGGRCQALEGPNRDLGGLILALGGPCQTIAMHRMPKPSNWRPLPGPGKPKPAPSKPKLW